MLDINIGHHNQGMSGHLLGLAVFTLGNVDKTVTLSQEPDTRQLAPASPGWVIGCVVTSARDITIKTSQILRMSALLNGIRNPNCPDYNAHTGLSDWSCVNLIKFLAPSISCGPQTLETNIESVHQQDMCRSELSQDLSYCHGSGLSSVMARPDESPAQTLYTCTLPIVSGDQDMSGIWRVQCGVMHNEKCRDR